VTFTLGQRADDSIDGYTLLHRIGSVILNTYWWVSNCSWYRTAALGIPRWKLTWESSKTVCYQSPRHGED
jgi:hypothetical protein